MPTEQANIKAHKAFSKLPWIMLLAVSAYSIGGATSADLSLEALGLRQFTTTERIHHQFGLVPVVLITSFPIFFFLVDSLGRYLAPRGVTVVAFPLRTKIIMLGVVTPLLIDSLLIAYYTNYLGELKLDAIVAWVSLLILAIGGTWLAWRSLHQSIAPLQSFIGTHQSRSGQPALTPLSLDELGLATAKLAELFNQQKALADRLQRSESLANAVIEKAGLLVVVLDHDGRIVRFNRACETLSGMSFAEVKGRYPWETFIPPEVADTVRENAFAALANNPKAMQGQYTNYWRTKDERRVLTEWFNTVHLDAHGAWIS